MSTGLPVDLGPGSRARHRPRLRGLWRAAAEGPSPARPRKAERRSPEFRRYLGIAGGPLAPTEGADEGGDRRDSFFIDEAQGRGAHHGDVDLAAQEVHISCVLDSEADGQR